MTTRAIAVSLDSWTSITRWYDTDHPIWNLEREKQERKIIADTQRELAEEADKRAQEQVTIRG